MALIPVKSPESYADFCRDRDIDSAVHFADNREGFCIAMVEKLGLRATDEKITRTEYDSIKGGIQAANALIPPKPTRAPLKDRYAAAATYQARQDLIAERLGLKEYSMEE